MRRIGLALAVLGVFAVVGCSGGAKAPAGSGSGTQKGVSGQFYYVNLFTPPIGGVITSDVGGINCGASSASVNNAVTPPQYVYAYYTTASGLTNRCGQTQFQWSQTVVLTAEGQGGNAFLAWAGDCSGTGTCTLKAGADKTVVAIFGPPGGGHGNFTSPAVHGPAYFDFLSGASPLKCTTCHGPTLAGQANAPSCSGCHTAAGWASWQDNCSFCHGATTAAAKAGYAFASHPSWSAPPDALSQRFTGSPAPDRTGAHQAHLLGVTPSGLSVAPPFTCATCHPVPTDLTHVDGAANRAQVVLSGAGQASLPPSLGTYNQGSGTCTTYCHGNGGSPAWSATGMQCGACHGVPPLGPHPVHRQRPDGLRGMPSRDDERLGRPHRGWQAPGRQPAVHRRTRRLQLPCGARPPLLRLHLPVHRGQSVLELPRRHLWRRHRPLLQRLPHDDGRLDRLGLQLLLLPRHQERDHAGRLQRGQPPHLVGPARRHRPAARPGPRRGPRPHRRPPGPPDRR